MEYTWDINKNALLKKHRGISFEEILQCVSEKKILDILEHPNQEKYPKQRIMVVECGGYAFHVPYVENEKGRFLKTIIPSRKSTRKYLEENYET